VFFLWGLGDILKPKMSDPDLCISGEKKPVTGVNVIKLFFFIADDKAK
jgi:hypothetical protein